MLACESGTKIDGRGIIFSNLFVDIKKNERVFK
jgi:hypothetical protein